MVRADRTDEPLVRRAAHGCDLGAERLRDLYGEGAHAAGRPDDEDPLTRPDATVIPERLEGGHASFRHGRRLPERQVRRPAHELAGGDAYELC